MLLQKAVGESNVQQEWRYGSKKNGKAAPDWFVIQNGTALLIEVKQSGLYLPAKKWGQLDEIQKDLTRNIGAVCIKCGNLRRKEEMVYVLFPIG